MTVDEALCRIVVVLNCTYDFQGIVLVNKNDKEGRKSCIVQSISRPGIN